MNKVLVKVRIFGVDCLTIARGLVCVWRVVGGAVEAAGWFGVAMILDFSWLPPEINSARIYAGAAAAEIVAVLA